jgi:hypothetical protein
MIKKIILLLLILGGLIGFICVLPKKTIEAGGSKTFVVNKSFSEIKKILIKGKFEEEILKANHATILEKKWVDMNFHLKGMEFRGKLNARVSVNNPKIGTIVVNLTHTIHVNKEMIDVKAELNKPLDVGLTEFKQHILIQPNDENSVKISIKNYLKLQRSMPEFLRNYAQQQMNDSSQQGLDNLERIIKDLK